MKKLNLPEFDFSFRMQGGREQIFDIVRRKYISLTPEEWVRQNFISWLIQYKKYPSGLIGIEKEIRLNELKKRYDAVVYNRNHSPEILIECKSPGVEITQKVFDQIAVYNMKLQVRYLIVTNGMEHYCCVVDTENKQYSFLETIPDYPDLFGNN